MSDETRPETIAVTHGIGLDREARAIAPPIHLSSTYAFEGFERPGPHEYTRTSNPSRDLLAGALARLEGGAGAVVTASGMAAIDLVLSLLRPGELVVAPHDCYGGTWRPLNARAERGQFDLAFADQGDAGALAAALDRRPKLVLAETPSNPLMRVRDIGALAARAHAVGAKLVVDNTSSRRRCNGRSSTAPTSSCIRRPSSSTATRTSSAAQPSPRRPPTPRRWRRGPTSPAPAGRRSTPI